MKSRNKMNWILSAAIGLTLAGVATAQYRVGTDGRALDANNRIGSGGVNTGPTQPLPYGVMGNNIITGNVTGGREFRGFVPYSDPRAFRGNTAGGLSDQFIRNSSGAPFGGVQQNNAQVVQPFYGASRAAPPPPGFAEQSIGSGAFVPAPEVTRAPGDLRLGQAVPSPMTTLPMPGQLVLPGPVDPSTQTSSVITASPLYGVRQWNAASPADQNFLDMNFGQGANIQDRIDPLTMQRLRAELTQPVPSDTAAEEGQDGAPGSGQDGTLNRATPRPFESPSNNSLTNDMTLSSGATGANQSINRNLTTGAGVRQRLLSARQQSGQYDELAKRLQQYRVVQEQGDAAANREYNRQVREKQAEEARKATAARPGVNPQVPGPQTPGPIAQQPTNVTPNPLPPVPIVPQPQEQTQPQQPPVAAGGDRPRPLQIQSLATDVKVQGLKEILQEAETLMKSGKYGTALEQYEMAEQVAPNNPLILVGRANVELAQSYYNRAEQHLRQAFLQDQALLMGQYDLRSWIGNERLEYLVKDLKAIAQQEQRQDKPAFLLAYIAYNTGNERQAAAYLDLAEKRAGGNDPLYSIVRKHWSLPAADPNELQK